MKILVLSDSHSSLRFMRLALQKIRPDAFIHLGDYYQDAQAMAEEFPEIPGYFVAGNCDSGRTPMGIPLTRREKLALLQCPDTAAELVSGGAVFEPVLGVTLDMCLEGTFHG